MSRCRFVIISYSLLNTVNVAKRHVICYITVGGTLSASIRLSHCVLQSCPGERGPGSSLANKCSNSHSNCIQIHTNVRPVFPFTAVDPHSCYLIGQWQEPWIWSCAHWLFSAWRIHYNPLFDKWIITLDFTRSNFLILLHTYACAYVSI